MNISGITIKNFRLLKNTEVQLHDRSTIIVGKNNSGKTSFTEVMNLFLNKKQNICSDDFNIKSLDEFITVANSKDEDQIQRNIPKISMKIKLNYSDADEWKNIVPFITTLEEKNSLEILFEYKPQKNDVFFKRIQDELEKQELTHEVLKSIIDDCYKVYKRPYKDEKEELDEVSDSEIENLFSFFVVEAQRSLDDGNSSGASKLSKLLNDYYLTQKEEIDLKDKIQELEKIIKGSNTDLDKSLGEFFGIFTDSFEQFGFPGLDGGKIKLKSNLKVSKLVENMLKIYYENENMLLPEKYNGLGHSNLLYIITKILSFKMINKEKNSSMLCLISIEEPEAHMHPQMQKVFIEKINSFLEKEKFNCQILITTHSTEIISSCELKNIRYFNRSKEGTSIKDLMQFKNDSKKNENIEFLKKYIKLGTAHMFFADKIILIEGLVERILMPLFIEKIAKGNAEYISLVEIGGAHMHKFKELLEFLEVKTLIITDIDSDKGDPKKETNEIKKDKNQKTTNQTLIQWIPKEENIEKLLSKSETEKIESNSIRVAYQTNLGEKGEIKCGRSFEEAFIIENTGYLLEKKDEIDSLKNQLKKYSTEESIKNNSYQIYDFIDRNKKKSDFAFDLLMNDSWKTPTYIEEGINWLLEK